MKQLEHFGGKISAAFVAVTMVCEFAPSTAQALPPPPPPLTISDGNSSAQINPTSQQGMFNWLVDGQNQLNQQWFWFRNGAGVPQSIDTLTFGPVLQPNASTLITSYANASFSIQITYSLVGGAPGSGTADLGEQIKIQNLTGSALTDFHFYQYADFNVNSSIVQLGKNLKGLYNEALVTSGNLSIDENVDSALAPGANRGETAQFNQTLNELNTQAGLLLNNVSSNGPGHTTWAFEWDPTATVLGPGQTFIISKDLNIAGVTPVPEPSAWSLVSIGLFAFGALRFHRSRPR